ncbi:type 1 glutamine amidotransferase [Corynebacterium aquilae]|uniref:type 1 glutamine amidotransferase n=1 Tax=Corynebacterium aquilae TaxID=203263 RepID=UPI000952724A|nr:type 1 glutamine amidotransferase [Corynebacterium aquilae]
MRTVVFIQHESDIPPGTLMMHARDIGAHATVIEAWSDGGAEAITQLERTLREDPTARAHTAVVVLGGRANAYADQRWPWLPATKELIRTCVATDVPYLGVCLGMQLMCVALGGQVTSPATDGAEYGPTRLASGMVVYEDHEDAVTKIPPQAQVLDSSEKYPQVVRAGRAVGVQYHPEVTEEIVRDFLADNDEIADKEAVVTAYLEHADDMSGHARKLVEGLAGA